MSGFEIAGLVLGTFPILCDAAKDLSGVLKKARSWWRFEATFEAFSSAIETQEVAYTQVLKRLLDPLVIPDDEYDSLLRDPMSPLWYETRIQEGLRQRLSSEHRYFMRNLSDLNEAILELQKLLPLDMLYHLDSNSLESELFRLHTSFSSEKDRQLHRITNINNELHLFFDRASSITRNAAQKPKLSFRDLHNQALEFHESLARNWQCSCDTVHTIGIAVNPAVLKSAKRDSEAFFDVLFETENKRKKLRLQIESVVVVTSKAGDPATQSTPTINIEAAGDMRDQMALKKQLKSVSLAADEKSVAALAFTSLSISSPPSSDPPRKSILKRMTRKLQKPWLMTEPLLTPTVARTTSNTSSVSSLNRSVSASTAVLTDNSSFSTAPEREPSISGSGISNISRVKFASTGSLTASFLEPNDTDPVSPTSICKIATHSSGDCCRNVLPLDGGRRLILEEEKRFDTFETQSINTFLQARSMRYNRIYIGLRFALTLLGLATSAWMPAQLSKDDIFLIHTGTHDKKAKPLGPYFSRSSRDICSASNPKDHHTWDAKSSLLLLGITLLELFQGDSLQNQPSWTESLDDDGMPNDMTMFCSAWLWINTAQSSMKAWIGEELGGDLYEAIRKCICYEFGRDDDFGDSRFAEVVYREVVVPLERCCPQF
ncbi:hypothetical protein CkaCkLH20_12995 [Colletotrichum karsti]|uniref:Uncharacterized protein n=1 Tax=Colletotrichum karsti TaxID=1095194 RepID=A0A9P6HTA4_9PEZI|nr:uncharacterized protein CkaCkLH20_12995 [Colletotrichum karsti]KAF9869510.1 hypothetical protein CkaCkLH20_12995 [Colletotrichum karsti]